MAEIIQPILTKLKSIKGLNLYNQYLTKLKLIKGLKFD